MTLSYQLDARVDCVEEGPWGVDELADGRGRGAGDEPQHLLRPRPCPAHRGARDPLRPPGSGLPRRAPSRGRGGGWSSRSGARRGADDQREAAAPPPCPWILREMKRIWRSLQ
jgi:hypothetical protein